MVLTPDELVELTGKSTRAQKRYGSQARELDALGIPYATRTDKTLIVYREFINAPRQTTHQKIDAPTVLFS